MSSIPALEDTLVIDKNGNYILETDEIKVVELDKEPFNMLIYPLPKQNEEYLTDNMLISNNPSLWNKVNMDVLSMNMISNVNTGCIGHGSREYVYYGFNNITEDSILLLNHKDIELDYNSVDFKLDTNDSEYILPNILSICSSSYNTVAVDINSSNSNKYNHRLQPDYIVCFDGVINNESKLAAEYFNIPIYLINRDKYNLLNEQKIEKYQSIDSLTKNDINEIFMLDSMSFNEKYNMIISNIDLKNNKLVDEVKEIISAYSIHNDISDIDVTKLFNNTIEEGVLNED